MADLATLQARLAEAEVAYHKLLTGTGEVEVQHGDMSVKYAYSSKGAEALATYIADLKTQIAALGGGEPQQLRRRGFVVDL